MINNRNYIFNLHIPGYVMKCYIGVLNPNGSRLVTYEIFKNSYKQLSAASDQGYYIGYTVKAIKVDLRTKLSNFAETYVLNGCFYNKD